jgi:hypothetical protein
MVSTTGRGLRSSRQCWPSADPKTDPGVERRVRVESGGILTEARAAAYDGKAVEYVRLREMCWAAGTLLWPPRNASYALLHDVCVPTTIRPSVLRSGVCNQPRNVACGL